MKKHFTLSLAFLTLIVPSVLKAQINPNLATRLQFILDSTCKYYKIKGASAAVLVPGVGIWKGATGVSKPNEPVTTDMLLGIGSNTKTYTSSIILKLQEMGKLSLSDTIGKWIHNQKNISGKITIRQILNHTSGLYNYTDNVHFNDSMVSNFSRIWKPEEELGFVNAPYFKPGANWHYSNTNYLIAGIIIKQVMGQPYEKTLRDFILTPQSLKNTIFFPQETTSKTIAYQWTMGVDGVSQKPILAVPGYSNNAMFSMATSAGAMMQTAEDNVNFWNNLYSGKIINASSLAEMKQSVYIGKSNTGGALRYGLGVFKYQDYLNGHTIYSHGGTIIGFISENAVDTVTGICFSVLTNQDSISNDVVLFNVLGALQKATLNTKLAGVSPETETVSSMNLYPNPASDHLNIMIDNMQEPVIMRIYDLFGKELMTKEISENNTTISLDALKNGTYLVRIQNPTNKMVSTNKIIIAR